MKWQCCRRTQSTKHALPTRLPSLDSQVCRAESPSNKATAHVTCGNSHVATTWCVRKSTAQHYTCAHGLQSVSTTAILWCDLQLPPPTCRPAREGGFDQSMGSARTYAVQRVGEGPCNKYVSQRAAASKTSDNHKHWHNKTTARRQMLRKRPPVMSKQQTHTSTHLGKHMRHTLLCLHRRLQPLWGGRCVN